MVFQSLLRAIVKILLLYLCYTLHFCFRCNVNRILTDDGKSCVTNCPDGFSERLERINGTEMFTRICVSQSEYAVLKHID